MKERFTKFSWMLKHKCGRAKPLSLKKIVKHFRTDGNPCGDTNPWIWTSTKCLGKGYWGVKATAGRVANPSATLKKGAKKKCLSRYTGRGAVAVEAFCPS